MFDKLISKLYSVFGALILGSIIFGGFLFASPTVNSSPALNTPTITATAEPTNFPCPIPTPVLFRVLPVESPTNLLTQTVNLMSGGDINRIDTGFGIFTSTLNVVEIDLLVDQTHKLTASTYVEERVSLGCTFGGYTLTRSTDLNGKELEIVQLSSVNPPVIFTNSVYLPVAVSR